MSFSPDGPPLGGASLDMHMDYDTFLALKRHFVPGSLREPSPTWLVPEPGIHLGFSGNGIRETETGCSVDFGSVTAIGEHRRLVRVENLSTSPLAVLLRNTDRRFQGRWASPDQGPGVADLPRTGAGADLELVFQGEALEEEAHRGALQLVAETVEGETRTFDLALEIHTRLDVPLGLYRFQGSSEPAPYDFGLVDPLAGTISGGPYVLTIETLGAPLDVALLDLPDWLSLEMKGYTRKGPAPGKFFEHRAPLEITLRPIPSLRFIGSRTGRIKVCTNDVRPEYRSVDLDLTAMVASPAAHVSAAIPVAPVVVAATGTQPLDIPLVNWGRAPARLTVESRSDAILVGTIPTVPGANGAQPGHEILQVFFDPQGYPAGRHTLGLTLQVDDGVSPALPVQIPVLVTGEASSPRAARFALSSSFWQVAGVCVFLLVLFLILLAFGGWA